MNYKKLSFASILALFMLIAGCKGDTGPAGPSLTGSITGVVLLFNSDGSQPIDRSGVTVSIQGTSISTITDSLGQWTINGVPTGSYTITETKQGYGMTEQQGFQFVGGSAYDLGTGSEFGYESSVGSIPLVQPPNFGVAIDSVMFFADSMINVWFIMSGKFDTIVGSSAGNDFLVLIGLDSNVNGADPNSYLYSDFPELDPSIGVHGTDEIFPSDLEYAGFRSGQIAYLIIYPLARFSNYGPVASSYYDIATGRRAFTSLDPHRKFLK